VTDESETTENSGHTAQIFLYALSAKGALSSESATGRIRCG